MDIETYGMAPSVALLFGATGSSLWRRAFSMNQKTYEKLKEKLKDTPSNPMGFLEGLAIYVDNDVEDDVVNIGPEELIRLRIKPAKTAVPDPNLPFDNP